MWNIIQIGQGGKKLWPGQDVDSQTDKRTDRQTDRQGDSYNPLPNFVGGGYNNLIKALATQLQPFL